MSRIPRAPRGLRVFVALVVSLASSFMLHGQKNAQAAPTSQPAGQQAAAKAESPLIAAGLWLGGIDLGGLSEPIALKILADKSGALFDMPAQNLYRYPLDSFSCSDKRLSFSLFEEGGTRLSFAGGITVSRVDKVPARIEGLFRRGEAEGSFYLVPAPKYPPEGEPFMIDTGRGRLPGTLLLPEGAGAHPLALLISGGGASDRDGNNYAVPGKNDALRMLALALRERGIASLRYDKRGAGEAYRLVMKEEELVFGDYVADAQAALCALMADKRFAEIFVIGYAEGALVGAAALAGDASSFGHRDNDRAGGRGLGGLVLLSASGRGVLENLELSFADLSEESRAEARAIVAGLLRGRFTEHPGPALADFFRPSFQPYLASWFKYDLAAQLRGLALPVLLVQGERDAQLGLADFNPLVAARPDAPAYVLPAMNHALKAVGADSEENFRAFSDPSFPLAPYLADLVAAFMRGELPSEGGAAEPGSGAQVPSAKRKDFERWRYDPATWARRFTAELVPRPAALSQREPESALPLPELRLPDSWLPLPELPPSRLR